MPARQADLPPELQTLKREIYDCFVSQKDCLSEATLFAYPRGDLIPAVS